MLRTFMVRTHYRIVSVVKKVIKATVSLCSLAFKSPITGINGSHQSFKDVLLDHISFKNINTFADWHFKVLNLNNNTQSAFPLEWWKPLLLKCSKMKLRFLSEKSICSVARALIYFDLRSESVAFIYFAVRWTVLLAVAFQATSAFIFSRHYIWDLAELFFIVNSFLKKKLFLNLISSGNTTAKLTRHINASLHLLLSLTPFKAHTPLISFKHTLDHKLISYTF